MLLHVLARADVIIPTRFHKGNGSEAGQRIQLAAKHHTLPLAQAQLDADVNLSRIGYAPLM